MRRRHAWTVGLGAVILAGGLAAWDALRADDQPATGGETEPHRSPIALAISADGTRLLTANQSAGSVSLVDTAAGQVLAEVPTGDRPAGVALSRDGRTGLVTHWYGYDLARLAVTEQGLKVTGRVDVGPEPRGVVFSKDETEAFVAVGASNEVVRVSLAEMAVTGRVSVGREPRGLALSADGTLLAVGNSRARTISIVDTRSFSVLRDLPMEGDNLRQISFGPDGLVYVANMKNRGFATTDSNIDLGWVLGQRVTRVTPDGSEAFETLTLDPRGKAMGDAHGLAINPAGTILAVSGGGTHEVMLFRLDGKRLPWRRNGSRDLMPPDLVEDARRFRRVPLGGRPTELAFAPDGKALYVANYLADAVQVVDAETGGLAHTIALGGPAEPSLERQGEILFHDAMRSSNQWYSCNTCHSDGHTNGGDYDTMNDGWHDYSTAHLRSRKKAPTLRRVDETGPWTWHGWQKNLDLAMAESFTKSMQGNMPSDGEVRAIVAYLSQLDYPRNPNRNPDGSLTEAARRGESLFQGKAGCASCHGGSEFTDGKVHDLGLGEPGDVYDGHNPPSLRGVYDKDPYLHDGRAATLEALLTEHHRPDELGDGQELSDAELADLIAYLKSL